MANELLEQILKNRNYNDDEINHIIYNNSLSIKDPLLLKNAYEAASLISKYCNDPESYIYVFGDYDVDGITSTYIMSSVLKECSKCYSTIHLPDRKDGYGLNITFCKKLVEVSIDTSKVLVITVDNGITCINEIKYLKDHGIEVVVLDHHEAKKVTPDCLIVDPFDTIESDEYKYLAGCGVVFKVCQILKAMYNQYDMMKYTPYLALGTLADMMLLSEENIAFIRYGINIMNSGKDYNYGLQQLIEYCGLTGEIYPENLSFDIIPKLNACGRMNDVMLAYSLFYCTKDDDCASIINRIVSLNDLRKKLTQNADRLIDKQVEAGSITDYSSTPFIMCVDSDYSGICGIIASKAIEKLNCPVSFIMFRDSTGNLSGSARAINAHYNMQYILNKEIAKDNLLYYGGHSVAAGFACDTMRYDKFVESVTETVQDISTSYYCEGVSDNEDLGWYDTELDLTDINKEVYESYAYIPFSVQPVFKISNVFCTSSKASKNNPKNIEYTFTKNNEFKRIWVWGQEPKPVVRQSVSIYGNITKDFRNRNNYTMRIANIMV